MRVLDCGQESDMFRRMQIQNYTKEDIHFIMGGSVLMPDANENQFNRIFGRDQLINFKANADNYKYSEPQSNIDSINWRNAKKHVEVSTITELKTLCACRAIIWNSELLELVADFDGLEEGKSGGVVWSYMPWSEPCRHFVIDLGYERFGSLEVNYLLQLEHMMVVANSQSMLVTSSDGTLENTLTAEYKSQNRLRIHLLDEYAKFNKEVRKAREQR